MRRYSIDLICLFTFYSYATSSFAAEDVRVDVARIQKNGAEIQPGMDRSRVFDLIGKPEETRHGNSGRGELLCYGVWQTGAFPAIGLVRLDEMGHVIFARISGNINTQRSSTERKTLFRLMDEIDRCITPKGTGFSPLAAIRARALAAEVGQKETIAVLEDYVHLSDGLRGRAAWYATGYSVRSLFRVDADSPWPPMLSKQPVVESNAPNQLESFPIAIVGGVPIVIAEERGISTGYGTGRAFAEHAKHNAKLREVLEDPGEPTEVYERAFLQFRQFSDPKWDTTSQCFRTRLLRQFAATIGDHYQENIDFDRLTEPRATDVWNQMFKRVLGLRLKWQKRELKYAASQVND